MYKIKGKAGISKNANNQYAMEKYNERICSLILPAHEL